MGSSERQRPFLRSESLSFFSSFKTAVFLSTEVGPLIRVKEGFLVMQVLEPLGRGRDGPLEPTEGVLALKSLGGRLELDVLKATPSFLTTEGVFLFNLKVNNKVNKF